MTLFSRGNNVHRFMTIKAEIYLQRYFQGISATDHSIENKYLPTTAAFFLRPDKIERL
jgi:hypothetical protein